MRSLHLRTMETPTVPAELEAYWKQLDCGFPRVAPVFADCMREARATLSKEGVDTYIESARFLGKMGRGAEPILIFLEKWPEVAKSLGEDILPAVIECVRRMWKSPNGNSITPFLQSLPATARRLQSPEQLRDYLDIVLDFMERTTGSIHGIQQTFPSPGLPELFRKIPLLLGQLSLAGLKLGGLRCALLQGPPRSANRLLQPAVGGQPRSAAARAARHAAGGQ